MAAGRWASTPSPRRSMRKPDTIEEVYEPYLMQLGFLDRTPRGRMATERAFEYFQVPRRMGGLQNTLF